MDTEDDSGEFLAETQKLVDQVKESTQNVVLVIIPMGLPGLGKSTLVKSILPALDQIGITYSIIESDQIRAELMEKMERTHPKLSRDERFEKTTKSSSNNYIKALDQKLKEPRSTHHIIFMDKNHPPNALPKIFSTIKSRAKCRVIKLAQVPRCKGYDQYPFSLNCIAQCLHRLIKRDDHYTLDNEDPLNSIKVGFLFANFYRRVKFDQSSIESLGFDGAIKVAMTNEEY